MNSAASVLLGPRESRYFSFLRWAAEPITHRDIGIRCRSLSIVRGGAWWVAVVEKVYFVSVVSCGDGGGTAAVREHHRNMPAGCANLARVCYC